MLLTSVEDELTVLAGDAAWRIGVVVSLAKFLVWTGYFPLYKCCVFQELFQDMTANGYIYLECFSY
jgi:hypothetical protein